MKGLVRIIAIFAAVFALSGTRGGASLSDREAKTEFQEALIFQETEDWEFDRHEFPALNNGGLAFSVARTVSEASRVRNLSEERNGSSQHPPHGFLSQRKDRLHGALWQLRHRQGHSADSRLPVRTVFVSNSQTSEDLGYHSHSQHSLCRSVQQRRGILHQ